MTVNAFYIHIYVWIYIDADCLLSLVLLCHRYLTTSHYCFFFSEQVYLSCNFRWFVLILFYKYIHTCLHSCYAIFETTFIHLLEMQIDLQVVGVHFPTLMQLASLYCNLNINIMYCNYKIIVIQTNIHNIISLCYNKYFAVTYTYVCNIRQYLAEHKTTKFV